MNIGQLRDDIRYSVTQKLTKKMWLTEENLYFYILLIYLIFAPLNLVLVRHVVVPYGKHRSPGWGPSIPSPVGWFLMESPTIWFSLLMFPTGRHSTDLRAVLLMAPFLIHYMHRTLIYPARLYFNMSGKKDPGMYLAVVASAFGYNLVNSYLQVRWVSHYKADYGDFWCKFIGGTVVFAVGMWANVWADVVLVRLKKQSGGYVIPRGGLFELVSCPNFLGEIIEWLAWAVMTWSWSGFAFFLNTCVCLVARAIATHTWYVEKFEDYPRQRKAVLPFLY